MNSKFFIPKAAIFFLFLGIVLLLTPFVPDEKILIWFLTTFIMGMFMTKIIKSLK